MIGRERELKLVDAFLDSAGSGTHALLLEGEAGIGKSTVWQAAVDAAAARGYRLALTQPTEAESRIPFAGLNDLFGDLADARVLELPAPQRAALDVALMRASPDAEPIQPLALSLAVLELMRLASSGMPFAVAVDDVQWLDDSTAAVVRFALRRLDGDRVIVIAAERTDSPGEVPAILADVPADRITRTSVAPLDTDGIDRLLDDVLTMG